MSRNAMSRLIGVLLICAWQNLSCECFQVTSHGSARKQFASSLKVSTNDNSNEGTISPTNAKDAYPVISRIANANWTGKCRYIGANLSPVPIKLVGGVRYDMVFNEGEEHFIKLSSFLTFPNGQTREVVMTGSREYKSSPDQPLKLSSEDGSGPIYMLLTELAPDTILLNEIEEATGKTILTASLSVIDKGNGIMELIQVSHEVGEDSKSPIEGHQSWRLYKNKAIEYNDFGVGVRDTTGR
mmetsp:Transcript_27092/g.41493  ORF Transcript_27092/g.41493 Transcript_27092/m.41493 type:complete len:241 (+) Transcript_27092:103-825(+)